MSGNMILMGEGKSVQIRGMGVIFKLFGSDTGGAFSIVEHPLAPRTLTAPHTHARGRVLLRAGR